MFQQPETPRPARGRPEPPIAIFHRHLLRLLPACAALLVLLPGSALARSAPRPAPAVKPAPKALYNDGYRGRYLLDGVWYVRLDPLDQGLTQGFERQKSVLGWTPVTVPNAWNAKDLSDASQRGTVGWYRKDFRVPTGARSVQWVLRFESVNYRARVYVNGHQVGKHEGAYLSFEIPAGRLSKRGVNHLVIRVDNRRSNNDLPPLQDQDNGTPGGGWWNYGGLLREVYLRKVDRVDISDFLARPSLPCRSCPASVLLRATLRNVAGGKRKVRVNASVGDQQAKFPGVTLPPHATRQVQAKVTIQNPRLWEPGDPQLYRVRASASVGRSTLAGYTVHIGIRSIKVKGGRLFINGLPATLRGASIHEDNPEVGAALDPALRRAYFGQLLALGGTITRTHYPLHPEFLEMADRAGVLVWDQIPFYRLGEDQMKLKSVRDKGLADVAAMIHRDQNHPSVLTWSLGNELPSRPAFGQSRYLHDASRLAKQLDGTRLVGVDVAGYPSVATPAVSDYKQLTALGLNDYFGWYPGPGGQLTDRNALGPYLDTMHQTYPRQALFITEFGAEANRSGPIDEKGTFEYQRDFMQFHVSTFDQKPFINGAVAWLLRDFKVRPGWDGGDPKPDPPYNQKGLSDQFGNPKPAFGETQRLYRNVQLAGAALRRAVDARIARARSARR